MPQRITQKVVNSFIKGLVTEAGELTFPENASVDELNCDIRRDGSRRRRLALEEEGGYLSSFTVSDSAPFVSDTWYNAGGINGLDFLVVQVGDNLRFYDKSAAPYSSGLSTETIDLTSHYATGVTSITNEVQMTSIQGALVVASPDIDTIYIERNNTTEALTATEISFRTRDFEWQGDRSTYDSEVATGSATTARKYDTANAGWAGNPGAAALTTYTGGGNYPPLTLPWFAGKDASNNFSKAEWDKIQGGTSLIGNGFYILDFFAKDRETASGVTGIGTDPVSSRFSCVETFGERVFYGGLTEEESGTILFSRIVEQLGDLGECFQQNDPTSENLSDLLDTDGGVIRISGCVGIQKLYNIGSSLFVFAQNGVWVIQGVDNVFRATEYSIQRVSQIGIQVPGSFVAAESVPFWWSRSGIHTLSFDQVTGQATEQNVSITTIQSFWDRLKPNQKEDVHAVYDRTNKRVYWGYPSEANAGTNKLNHLLILDTQLGAFLPWTVEVSGSGDYIAGLAFYEGFGEGSIVQDVMTSNGDNVVLSTGDNVINTVVTGFETGDPAVTALIVDGTTSKLTMGGFTGRDYLDWGSVDYTSYAVAGYDFLGDLTLQKSAPYVTTYMRLTEDGWEGDEETGYNPTNDSSLLMSAFWDFSRNASSNAQQVYRFKHVPILDEADLSSFDYPEDVITTRTKVRGRGRSMRLRFESETGKDFILLGYAVIGGVNGRY